MYSHVPVRNPTDALHGSRRAPPPPVTATAAGDAAADATPAGGAEARLDVKLDGSDRLLGSDHRNRGAIGPRPPRCACSGSLGAPARAPARRSGRRNYDGQRGGHHYDQGTTMTGQHASSWYG